MKNKYEKIQNTRDNIDYDFDWQSAAFSHPERVVRLATSFSGIGAIEQAFRKLGIKHEIQFAGDIDADCKTSYFANYDITEDRWHTDIHSMDATPYKGKVDLFVGGAPCQAFSMRGKRGGFEDTRGTLFREFARIVIECEPKVFIFENVKGMLSHDNGNTWRTIKQTFEDDCGYDVYYQVLNGKDYGIPQSRERIYCIGFKRETEFKYPRPIPLDKNMYDFLDEKFDAKYVLKDKGVHFITESVNHQKSYTQINGKVQLCQKRNQQFNWHGDFVYHPLTLRETPESNETIFRTSDFEEEYFLPEADGMYALAKEGDGFRMLKDKNIPVKAGYGRYRKLTPKECLRLMGFGEDFKIVVSDTAAYKQSGNSIIVNVLEAILKKIDITQYGEDL